MVVVSGVRRGSMWLLSVFFLVAALLTALPGTARAAAADPLVGSVGPTGLWTVPGADPFYFGVAGDTPFLGDFNRDGVRTPGLYRPTTGLAYVRNTLDTGVADLSWFIGNPEDQPIVGDFDGDGTDSVGVYPTVSATRATWLSRAISMATEWTPSVCIGPQPARCS